MNRKTFIRQIGVLSTITILKPSTVFGSQANSAIRVGIIGCGNRGTTVLSSIIKNTNAVAIAMADLFDDRLQTSKTKLNGLNVGKGLPEIDSANTYLGSKAYQRLLENKNVDAVLVSTPAYAHPAFLEASVNAGKHVYCEKPVSPDVAGCNRVIHIGEKLNNKLSVAIGFQIRYASPYVEMVRRIQAGDIGELVTVQLYYFSSGTEIHPFPGVSDDEFRIRNHYHFKALSGGILLDQGIHMLDVCNWALKNHPMSAIGTGGSKGGPGIGDAWNNYQILYKYPDDINVSIHSTQVGPQFGDVCCRFLGTKGIAEAHYGGGVFINGENDWDSGVLRAVSELSPEQKATGVFLSSLDDADANKDIAFIKSIESGDHLNEARSGAESTLSAILGREAAQAGKRITWEEVVKSNLRLDPKLNLSRFDHS